jgi:hypothetical protein
MKQWMMRGIPLAIVAAATAYYSFFYTPDTLSHSTIGTTHSFSYTLPDGALAIEDDWRVFLSLGDGRFWMGTQAQFETTVFNYMAAGNFTPCLEYTPTYDDNKKPPKKLVMPAALNVNNPSSIDPLRVPLAAAEAVKLQSTRDPKPGDIITYIVTYQHNVESCTDSLRGDFKFTFDKDVLTFTGYEGFHNEYKPNTAADPNVDGNIVLNFHRLKNSEQRNVFLYFTTQNFEYGTVTMDQKPRVDYTASQTSVAACPEKPVTASDAMMAQQITNSHDPNKKFAAQHKICTGDQFVEFTVTFQNDGPGPTGSVKVLDELDIYLKRQLPSLIAHSTPNPPIITFETTATNDRSVVFNFPGLQLRGLAEPGYGTAFGEDATMATFTFRCEIDPTYTNSFCNAVLNKARIYFDCNPPIETSIAMSPIYCNTCDPCSMLSDSLVTDSFVVGGNILPPGFPPPSGYTFYHWYPEEGLSNPLIANPVLTSLKHREYTLVASSGGPSCHYQIVRVKSANSCALQIQVTPPVVGTCSGSSSGTITATASGYSGSPADLIWQDCNTGVSSTKTYVPGYTQYYFGVTDNSTGCTAEVVYTVPEPPPLQVDDIANNCTADLLISGGTPPYTVNWNYVDGNNSPQTATGASLPLAGKSSVIATVIDANGCSTVFSPQRANCGGIPTWVWYALGGLVVVAAAIVLYNYFKK